MVETLNTRGFPFLFIKAKWKVPTTPFKRQFPLLTYPTIIVLRPLSEKLLKVLNMLVNLSTCLGELLP